LASEGKEENPRLSPFLNHLKFELDCCNQVPHNLLTLYPTPKAHAEPIQVPYPNKPLYAQLPFSLAQAIRTRRTQYYPSKTQWSKSNLTRNRRGKKSNPPPETGSTVGVIRMARNISISNITPFPSRDLAKGMEQPSS